MQGMDIYSNILYVKEEFAALSALAHRCADADKYRPETCCVIGNYYSLRWVGRAGAARGCSRGVAEGLGGICHVVCRTGGVGDCLGMVV